MIIIIIQVTMLEVEHLAVNYQDVSADRDRVITAPNMKRAYGDSVILIQREE
jgi:hypothetical protein